MQYDDMEYALYKTTKITLTFLKQKVFLNFGSIKNSKNHYVSF